MPGARGGTPRVPGLRERGTPNGVRLRFEQGEEVAEEGEARGGVGVGWSVQTPVRGENLAGFLQLAGQDEGEHQIVAAMDGQRMDVPEQLCRGRCHSPVNGFSQIDTSAASALK